MDPSILQKILDGFQQALAPGMAQLKAWLIMTMSGLVFFDLCLSVILGYFAGYWRHGVVLALKVAIVVPLFVAPGFPVILQTGIDWSVQAGLKIGGNALEPRQFLDPGLLLQQGIKTGRMLKDLALANSAWYQLNLYIPYFFVWIGYVMAYAAMSVNVFYLQVEIYIALPILLIASLGFFSKLTAPMAGGVMSFALKVWARFIMDAMLASIVYKLAPILSPAIPSGSPFDAAIEQALIMVIAVWVVAALFIMSPFIVTRILSGHTSMTALGALQTVTGMATILLSANSLAHAVGSRMVPQHGLSLPSGSQGSAGGGATPAWGHVDFEQAQIPPTAPAPAATHNALREGGRLLLPPGGNA